MYEISNLKDVKSSTKSTKWIWTQFLKEKSVNILVAEQSRGKSQLALQLCVELMKSRRKQRFLLNAPIYSKFAKVLYISSEMNEETIAQRFKELGGNRCKRSEDNFKFVYCPMLEFHRLESYIDLVKPNLVIIDIFDCLLRGNGFDVNSYADLNDCAAKLRKFNTTFLLVHHMNKNKTTMGSVGALSAMDSRMEMLETYRESIDDETVIHQSIHVYGKAVMDRTVQVKFTYPSFEMDYTEEEEELLEKPLGRLMERVIKKYMDKKESVEDGQYPAEAHITGTYQEVAAKLGMIDKYQFSPKALANLLATNREVLEANYIYFAIKKKTKCKVIDIWHDPEQEEKTILEDE